MRLPEPEKQWIPYYIDTMNQRILWLDYDLTEMSSPFFHVSVREALKKGVHVTQTPLSTIGQMEPYSYASPIKGFIFHTSRCGSTMISNILRSAGNVVLSELQSFSALLMPFDSGYWPPTLKDFSGLVRRLLTGLMVCYCESGNNIIVKFSSWNILMLQTIKALWPDVPCLFVCREPLEILVSNEDRRAGWVKMKDFPVIASSLTGLTLSQIRNQSWQEFAAEVLQQFYYGGIVLKRECADSTLILDYSQLNRVNLINLFEFFGMSKELLDRIDFPKLASVHSKFGVGGIPFENDSQTKREKASDILRDLTDRKLIGSYRALMQLI
jgi:hypothetical protein